ncbi:hypothetical protein HHK36_011608 [Tetracentron sinense]|uniref:Uncharacterized protein n=1 Tax=Tetracentron sinense TaxID=13715 RepID=A0A835DKK2_TETSI|nr:hypothetical protein HHK36_011608 [Tetracentron sinense]
MERKTRIESKSYPRGSIQFHAAVLAAPGSLSSCSISFFERCVSLDVMGLLKGSLPVCPRNLHCSQWARTYMKYCLCSLKDGVSLSLGFASVISWGVAEIPQIITNYKGKSAEGLSIAFLMTWIVGDLFNLFGCMLEPATLPTQYYMAMLYTFTTVILASQTIYYGHIYQRLKSSRRGPKDPKIHHKERQTNNDFGEKQAKLAEKWTNESSVAVDVPLSSPIPVAAPVLPHDGSLGRELYYMSARSLVKSHTPTAGSYLVHLRSNERTASTSFHDPDSVEEPLLAGIVSTQSAPPLNTKSMLCVISAVMFFLNSFDLHLSVNNRTYMVFERPAPGVVIRVGRKILQVEKAAT